jgi:hypothetical protein
MVGAAGAVQIVKERLLTEPPAVVTTTGPVVVPAPTVTTSCVLVLVTMLAAVPFMVTEEALSKSVPVIVTVVPTGPAAGVKLLAVGGSTDKPPKRRTK